ncbi:MAG: hypothetical protein ACHQJX_13540 [Candidatus Acidiferrales bacterium]|jgi:hypothetical protein|nr:hypothetical protein [Candidatus Acidoferrales bacterium]
MALKLYAKHQLYTIPAETYTEKVAAHGRMKRTVIIILAACIAAAAVLAYVYRAHEKASQLRAEDAQFAVQPGSVAANSRGGASTSANSTDLVHQLPAGASAVVFADVAALRAAPIGRELSGLAPTSAQDPEYTTFVRSTGFDYSRDLDRVALALWPKDSPTTIVAIAQGKFNEAKIERYAVRNGGRIVEHGQWKIYEVPEANPTRIVRFVFLSSTEIILADGPGISAMLDAAHERLDSQMSQRIARVAGAPIYAVARTPDLAKDIGVDETHSAQLAHLLQSVHNITLAGLPAGQNLKVAATAECDSTLDAFQLSTAFEGLVWMGRAAMADPKTRQQIGPQWPTLDALLKAADISHDDHFVRLHLQITPQILRATVAVPPNGPSRK